MKFTTLLFLAATVITSVAASSDAVADAELLKRDPKALPQRCKRHCLDKTHCECFGPDDCQCVSNGIGNRVKRTAARRGCGVTCRGSCMCYGPEGPCVCTRG